MTKQIALEELHKLANGDTDRDRAIKWIKYYRWENTIVPTGTVVINEHIINWIKSFFRIKEVDLDE